MKKKSRTLFSDRNLEAQLRSFLATEFQDLEDAAGVAIRAGAKRMRQLAIQDAKRAFEKSDHPASPNFPKAFKAYHLKPDDGRGHASYVRSGVRFMHLFETGGTINPGKNMIVRTKLGKLLGLPRHNKTTQLQSTLDQLRRQYGASAIYIKKIADGTTLIWLRTKTSMRPIYQIRPQVTVGRHLNFMDIAHKVGNAIPKNIKRILRNG